MVQVKTILKNIELSFKKILKATLLIILPAKNSDLPPLNALKKVLVFRLDQRIGNGLLLLPLLRAIKKSRPDIQVDLLIHHPVAELFQATAGNLVDRIWSYNQSKLIVLPWRMAIFFGRLRRQKYDLIITSHNPDNFSLSQALAGRWMKPACLVGFKWKDSDKFYDIAVTSTTKKHYSDAMIDLWRAFDPQANFQSGGLKIPDELMIAMKRKFPQYANGGILIWLGATGKKVLSVEIVEQLVTITASAGDAPILYAAGPADTGHVAGYPKEISENTLIWKTPLLETAAFFSLFKLFISPDTGPMHLAAALGIPTVTIFVESNITQYGYNDGEKHFALQWQEDDAGRQVVEKALGKILDNV